MYMPEGPDTLWLDITNIVGGLVTLLGVLAVASGVVHELGHRLVHRRRLVDGGAFEPPGLRVTMADGRPIEPR